jgi:peptide/nickel transport system substrate-binding protein
MSLKRKRSLAAAVIAVAAGAALVLSGCSGGTPTSNSSGKASTVTVFNGSVGTLSENFNPFSPTQLQPTSGVIYESLYYYNLAKQSTPQPLLATGFTWNSGGTVLTITTRSGVKWSDGTAFSAKDVAYTFNLIHSKPALNTSGLNATAKATSDSTVVLTFPNKSFTQEAQVLGNQAIIPQHIWSKVADPTTFTNQTPIGTGAYRLKTFTPQSYLLVKNANYWQSGKPSVDQVRYISLSNADAATAALQNGSVDLMSSFLPSLKTLVAGHKDLSYVNTPGATTALFTCSSTALGCTGPQTDVQVRQAIYYAMDRGQMNKLAAAGFAAPASPTMLLPFVNKQYIADSANDEVPQSANVSKAKGILEADGWKLGSDGYYQKGGQPLSLTVQVVSGWTDYDSDCTTLVSQLKAAGIKLAVNQVAQNVWTNNEVQGTFQLSMDSIGLGASNSPYYTYAPHFLSTNTAKVGQTAGSNGNYARYSNPKVDAAIKAVAATNDASAQKAAYATIQTEIVRDMPYIPIYVNSTLTEFNTSHATGWPSAGNLYAYPAAWKTWDNGIVLKTIKPVN